MAENTSEVENLAPTATGIRAPSYAQLSRADKIKVGLADDIGINKPKIEPTKEDKRIQRYQKVESVANTLYMGEFAGFLASLTIGAGAKRLGLTRTRSVLHAIFTAPFEALRETRLNELHQLPAHYMKAVHRHAQEAAQDAALRIIKKANKGKTEAEIAEIFANTDWANFDYSQLRGGKTTKKIMDAAERNMESLSKSGEAFGAKVAGQMSGSTSKADAALHQGLTSLSNTDAGRGAEGLVQRFINWRGEQRLKAHTKALGKAEHALTHETPDIFGKIKNFFTGRKPQVFSEHAALSEATNYMTAARNATDSAERATHMKLAYSSLEEAAKNAKGDKALLGRIGKVIDHVKKSGSAAESVHFLEGMKAEGLSGMVKSLGKAGGRIPLFTALLGIGIAGGVGAKLLISRQQGRQEREALHQMIADIGDDNHPLVEAAKRSHLKQAGGRTFGTGIAIAGDVLNGALASSPMGAGNGAVLTAAMTLPMIGPMLVKENPLLNAYATLKQADEGKIDLPEGQKQLCVAQLVAALPNVAEHGGIYNRLVPPVAEAITAKNLTAGQTVKLLADEVQFTALAAEVSKKKQDEAAVVAAVAPETAVQAEPASDKVVQTAPTVAPLAQEPAEKIVAANDNGETPHHAAHHEHHDHDHEKAHHAHGEAIASATGDSPKPLTKISAAHGEHQGTLVAQQKVAGYNG